MCSRYGCMFMLCHVSPFPLCILLSASIFTTPLLHPWVVVRGNEAQINLGDRRTIFVLTKTLHDLFGSMLWSASPTYSFLPSYHLR
ncbi:hypothetical protein FPV67DRAFT_1082115 [Lyophyllum atratum]|nr:hypothetical protein FPV67DRAFT_1082115 [Lyophyllum atratum]